MARSKLLLLILAVFLLAMVCRPANSAEPSEQKQPSETAETAQKTADINALLEAVSEGDLKKVEALVAKVGVDAEDEKGSRPLNRAVGKGHPEIVRYLIDNGADVNHVGKYKYTPLFVLTWAEHDHVIDIAELLLKAGANPDVKDEWGTTLFYTAIRMSSKHGPSFVDLLLKHIPEINEPHGRQGWTYLSMVACLGTVEQTKTLLSRGVDIHATTKRHETALHVALEYRNNDIAKLLIANGADVTRTIPFTSILQMPHTRHVTPLVFVLLREPGTDIELLRLLIESAVDINTRDDAGLTALHYAAMWGDVDIITLLLKAGSLINIEDNIGRTPLHFAVSTRNTPLRKFLIDQGACEDIAPMRSGTKPEFGERADIRSLGLERRYGSGDIGQPSVQTVELTFSINEDDVTIYSAPEEQVYLHIRDLVPFMRIGEPQLPKKTFTVQLPHDSEILVVEVIGGKFRTIDGGYRIIAGMQGFERNGGLHYPNEDSIYERDAYYPGEWVKYETGKDNNNTYAFVRFYPVQYLPTEGKVVVATEAKLKVYYRQTEGIAEKDHSGKDTTINTTLPVSIAQSVIIFPEEVRPAATKLKEFHEKQEGISTVLVSIESIDSSLSPAEDVPFAGYANTELKDRDTIVNYDYTLAKKIISYLRDTKAHPEVEYVTILGDAGLVPASYMFLTTYHDAKGYREAGVTYTEWGGTDFFYTSPDYDFVPNYKMGRLPVNNNEEAIAMVEKIQRWHEHANQEWFKNVYIHSSTRDAWERLYRLPVLKFNSQFTEPIFSRMHVTESFSGTGLFTRDRLQAALKKGRLGFVMLFAHGKPGGTAGLRVADIMAYERVDELPIVVADSCNLLTWYCDNQKALVEAGTNHHTTFGEAILKSPAAGIACFGQGNMSTSSMLFYYDTGTIKVGKYTSSGELTYNTLKSYHEGADTLGAMSYDSMFEFVATNEMEFWMNRCSLLMSAFLGDPALKIPVRPKLCVPE